MRWALTLLWLPLAAAGQTILTSLGDPINLVAPAVNADGSAVLFAAATGPDGVPRKGTNLYLYSTVQGTRRLTSYAGTTTLTGVTSVSYAAGLAAYAALPTGPGSAEEVHLLDPATGADRTLASDTQGCVQPMCVNCFRACVGPVHLSSDASKALYAVAQQQPLRVVNADGSGALTLPVYQGQLAPSPQRVISKSGQVVFTSAAPSGPTFVATAANIYRIGLDGSGLTQVTSFTDARIYAANATISDDGSLIAFESNYSASGPRSDSQIWVARADGTGLRQVSIGPGSATNPSLSADGATLLYVQDGQIQCVRTSGGAAPLNLTGLSVSVARFPALSADGSRAIFTSGPPFGNPVAIYATGTAAPGGFQSIYVPRVVNAGGVGAAAGFAAPSPGSLISVYGANLAPGELAQAAGFPLPVTLQGLSLLVNSEAVPLQAVTPWQINAQLPQTVPSGTATFQVLYQDGTRLPALSVEVKPSAPAVFVYPYVQGALYYSQAAAFHAGTAIPADQDHPAAAGETLEMYGLGLGVTDPVVAAGLAAPSSPPARAVTPPRVRIGGLDATITFAGLAPGLAGIYQVNAIVPAGLKPGLQGLAWMGPDDGFASASVAVK